MMTEQTAKFKDISGTPLQEGDMVATRYEQLFRIGQITGFTNKRVLVKFQFGINADSPEAYQTAKFSPWLLAKVCNQNVGLMDYYDEYNSI